jgi:hypothetical protein
MNYEDLRQLWHQVLQDAGLMQLHDRPKETVELRDMTRRHELFVGMGRWKRYEPFSVAARLDWTWDALLSTRGAWQEEEVLRELVGDDHMGMDTVRPWLRIDVRLSASLPWGSPLPMPDAATRQRWMLAVEKRVKPLLPTDAEWAEGLPSILSHCSEPEVKAECDAQGNLLLTGVRLSAWQGIDLPRQWDDPDRDYEEWPENALREFVGRVQRALEAWGGCLRLLV